MGKRALCSVVAAVTVATVLAFTVSPISPTVAWAALTASEIVERPSSPALHNGTRALKILRADVLKIAHDYAHQRYRAVCADLTQKERQHLGGTSQCMLKIALINAFVPIKTFTITAAKLSKHDSQGAVSVYVNGNKKHHFQAFVRWEGGAYRLDHQTGWHPKL